MKDKVTAIVSNALVVGDKTIKYANVGRYVYNEPVATAQANVAPLVEKQPTQPIPPVATEPAIQPEQAQPPAREVAPTNPDFIESAQLSSYIAEVVATIQRRQEALVQRGISPESFPVLENALDSLNKFHQFILDHSREELLSTAAGTANEFMPIRESFAHNSAYEVVTYVPQDTGVVEMINYVMQQKALLARSLWQELKEKAGINPIAPVPGRTKFNPHIHDDNVAHRISVPDPKLDHMIYGVLHIGLSDDSGRPLQKAAVKQILYDRSLNMPDQAGSSSDNGAPLGYQKHQG